MVVVVVVIVVVVVVVVVGVVVVVVKQVARWGGDFLRDALSFWFQSVFYDDV